MKIHQLLVGASPGDAITQMALRLREALRFLGDSEIFALHIDDRINNHGLQVRSAAEFPHMTTSDVVVYHASMGEPFIDVLLKHTQAKIILHYHNITPEHFFETTSPQHALTSHWGRRQLHVLRPLVFAASADSLYNAKELEEIGYDNIHVAPVGLLPHRLVPLARGVEHNDLTERFADGYMITVSQQLSHKRIELAIQALHLTQTVWEHPDFGLVVIGRTPDVRYAASLTTLARELRIPHIEFHSGASDDFVASAISGATALVVTSDHEGLGIPAIEAMSLGTPVIARGCAATPDTLGNAAIVSTHTDGAEWIAASTHLLLTSPSARNELVRRGHQRADELEQAGSVWNYLHWLESVLS